jgi:hypothetical protein
VTGLPAFQIQGDKTGRGRKRKLGQTAEFSAPSIGGLPPGALELARVGNSNSGSGDSTRRKATTQPTDDRPTPSSPTAANRITRGPHRGDVKRPRPDRSQHLVYEQLRELINALTFAEVLGMCPNTFLTIIWKHSAGFQEADWARRERLFWIKVRQWLKRNGVEHRCLWVREKGRQKGPHLHALLHVPEGLRGKFAQYIQETENLSQGGVDLQPSRSKAQHVGLLLYFMKTADRTDFRYRDSGTFNVSDLLGIEHRGSTLPVKEQRYGVSHNLGPRARAKSGFVDARIVEESAAQLGNLRRQQECRSHLALAVCDAGKEKVRKPSESHKQPYGHGATPPRAKRPHSAWLG